MTSGGPPRVVLNDAWLASLPVEGFIIYDPTAPLAPFRYASADRVSPNVLTRSAVDVARRRQDPLHVRLTPGGVPQVIHVSHHFFLVHKGALTNELFLSGVRLCGRPCSA